MATVNSGTNAPQVQTIVLKSGQSAYIPVGATILSVDGSGSLTSDCMDVTPLPSKCYRFRWLTTDDSTVTNPAWENGKLAGVSINGVYYSADIDFEDEWGVANFILASSNGAFKIMFVDQDDTVAGTALRRFDIVMRGPETLLANTYLKMVPDNVDGVSGAEIRVLGVPVDCADYDNT